MSDPLKKLLEDADDAAAAVPGVRGDVARIVRRRARNQRITRSMLTTVAIVVLGLVAIEFPSNRAMRRGQKIAMTKAEIRSAQIDAEVDRMTAAYLEKHVSAARVAVASQADEYLWQLSQQRDRAALILVRGADRIYNQSHDRLAAEASYRLAIQLFPDAPASLIAQQRLREFDSKGNES